MLQLTGLSKSYGGRTLFQGVTWRVNPGDRWGLVGPNGAGKTTLLRIIAGEAPADDGDVACPKGWRMGFLPQEVRRTGNGRVLEEAIASIPEAGPLEKELRRLEEAMSTAATEEAAEALGAEYSNVQDRFLAIDGFSVEARAREILGGLGFAEDDLDRPLSELSGGWGMRVHLAGLLLAQPDILLLDEPTNHLDLQSLEWVEGFMADYPGAWVVVSHDRYFLNRLVSSIADLRVDGVDQYAGNYDFFIGERDEREAQWEREAEGHLKKMADMQQFVDRFKAKASKARQAQSKAKQIQRMEKDLAPQTEASNLRKRSRKRPVKIRLPDPERSGRHTLTLRDVRKAWPLEDGGELVVYEAVNFQAERGDHVALVGPNGAGKSTLLKVLADATEFQSGERILGHNVTTYHYGQHQADELHPSHSVLQELRTVMPGAGETQVRGLLGAFLFSEDEVEKRIEVLSGGEKARVALAKMLARPANVLLLDEPTNHLDLESREVLERALAAYTGTIVFVSHDRYFINRVANKLVEVQAGEQPMTYPGDYDYWVWKKSETAAPAQAHTPGAPPPPKRDAKSAPKAAAKPSAKPNHKKEARPAKKNANKAPKPPQPPKPVASAPSSPAPKTQVPPRSSISKNARQKIEREVEALETEIADIERRLMEIDGALALPDVYADPARFNALLAERNELDPRLQRRMTKWEERSAKLQR